MVLEMYFYRVLVGDTCLCLCFHKMLFLNASPTLKFISNPSLKYLRILYFTRTRASLTWK